MRVISKPTDDPKTVYTACISKVRDSSLKLQLQSVADLVETAADEYDQEGLNKSWFNVATHENVGFIPREEMEKVYTHRMVGSKSPGRSIYDKIKGSAEQNICPICAQRTVSTLDHYLPKSNFPSLVVVPYNLIPACSDCNKNKKAEVPDDAESQTLHPYYDDVTNEQWLFANVIEDQPASIKFIVKTPDAWQQVLQDRVNFHFNTFKLSDLYTSQAAVELSNIRGQMIRLFDQGGEIAVRDHLHEAADSRRTNFLNSWQTAMYQSLALSDWYCQGGFC